MSLHLIAHERPREPTAPISLSMSRRLVGGQVNFYSLARRESSMWAPVGRVGLADGSLIRFGRRLETDGFVSNDRLQMSAPKGGKRSCWCSHMRALSCKLVISGSLTDIAEPRWLPGSAGSRKQNVAGGKHAHDWQLSIIGACLLSALCSLLWLSALYPLLFARVRA